MKPVHLSAISVAFWVLLIGPIQPVGAALIETAIVALDLPSSSSSGDTLPSGKTSFDVGSSFVVEVWVKSLASEGINVAIVDVDYTTLPVDVTNPSVSSNFGVLSQGTVDDPVGLVDELGGGNLGAPDTALNTWAKLATLTVNAVAEGDADFQVQPSEAGFLLYGGSSMVDWADVSLDTLTVTIVGPADPNDPLDPNTGIDPNDPNSSLDPNTSVDPNNATDPNSGSDPNAGGDGDQTEPGGCGTIGMVLIGITLAGFYYLSMTGSKQGLHK